MSSSTDFRSSTATHSNTTPDTAVWDQPRNNVLVANRLTSNLTRPQSQNQMLQRQPDALDDFI